MSVEFEEQEFTQAPNQVDHSSHGVVTDLMFKIGLAKTPAQANIVLLIIAVVATGLAIYLLLPARAPQGVNPIMPGQALPGQP